MTEGPRAGEPSPAGRPSPAGPPNPPYYAVVFTSVRPPSSEDGDGETRDDGYAAAAERMEQLVTGRPGYLGMDSARGADGLGITVSYWRDEGSIAAWRDQIEHESARRSGRDHWYEAFTVHVARVERAYRFDR